VVPASCAALAKAPAAASRVLASSQATVRGNTFAHAFRIALLAFIGTTLLSLLAMSAIPFRKAEPASWETSAEPAAAETA
jgi:hypothetical protein